jgi:hypothetical protein
MLSTQGHWTGRDLYRATPAVTQDLGFSSLTNPMDRPIQSPHTTHKEMWRTYSNPDPHGSVNTVNNQSINQREVGWPSQQQTVGLLELLGEWVTILTANAPIFWVAQKIGNRSRTERPCVTSNVEIEACTNLLHIHVRWRRHVKYRHSWSACLSRKVYKLTDWLTDYLLFHVPLKNFSLTWRRHHYRWRAVTFRSMLGAKGLWAVRDLYRAIPAVTWVPFFPVSSEGPPRLIAS